MSCLNVLVCSFILATTAVVIGLALPKWYESHHPDWHPRSYVKGNLWHVCYDPDTPGWQVMGGEVVWNNATQKYRMCGSTLEVVKTSPDYYADVQGSIGLVGCGLAISLITLMLFCIWGLKRYHDNKNQGPLVRRIGIISSIMAVLSGSFILAAAILFSLSLDHIVHHTTEKDFGFWLMVVGGCFQMLVGLSSAAFLYAQHLERRRPSGLNIMMNCQTIQVTRQTKSSKA